LPPTIGEPTSREPRPDVPPPTSEFHVEMSDMPTASREPHPGDDSAALLCQMRANSGKITGFIVSVEPELRALIRSFAVPRPLQKPMTTSSKFLHPTAGALADSTSGVATAAAVLRHLSGVDPEMFSPTCREWRPRHVDDHTASACLVKADSGQTGRAASCAELSHLATRVLTDPASQRVATAAASLRPLAMGECEQVSRDQGNFSSVIDGFEPELQAFIASFVTRGRLAHQGSSYAELLYLNAEALDNHTVGGVEAAATTLPYLAKGECEQLPLDLGDFTSFMDGFEPELQAFIASFVTRGRFVNQGSSCADLLYVNVEALDNHTVGGVEAAAATLRYLAKGGCEQLPLDLGDFTSFIDGFEPELQAFIASFVTRGRLVNQAASCAELLHLIAEALDIHIVGGAKATAAAATLRQLAMGECEQLPLDLGNFTIEGFEVELQVIIDSFVTRGILVDQAVSCTELPLLDAEALDIPTVGGAAAAVAVLRHLASVDLEVFSPTSRERRPHHADGHMASVCLVKVDLGQTDRAASGAELARVASGAAAAPASLQHLAIGREQLCLDMSNFTAASCAEVLHLDAEVSDIPAFEKAAAVVASSRTPPTVAKKAIRMTTHSEVFDHPPSLVSSVHIEAIKSEECLAGFRFPFRDLEVLQGISLQRDLRLGSSLTAMLFTAWFLFVMAQAAHMVRPFGPVTSGGMLGPHNSLTARLLPCACCADSLNLSLPTRGGCYPLASALGGLGELAENMQLFGGGFTDENLNVQGVQLSPNNREIVGLLCAEIGPLCADGVSWLQNKQSPVEVKANVETFASKFTFFDSSSHLHFPMHSDLFASFAARSDGEICGQNELRSLTALRGKVLAAPLLKQATSSLIEFQGGTRWMIAVSMDVVSKAAVESVHDSRGCLLLIIALVMTFPHLLRFRETPCWGAMPNDELQHARVRLRVMAACETFMGTEAATADDVVLSDRGIDGQGNFVGFATVLEIIVLWGDNKTGMDGQGRADHAFDHAFGADDVVDLAQSYKRTGPMRQQHISMERHHFFIPGDMGVPCRDVVVDVFGMPCLYKSVDLLSAAPGKWAVRKENSIVSLTAGGSFVMRQVRLKANEIMRRGRWAEDYRRSYVREGRVRAKNGVTTVLTSAAVSHKMSSARHARV
jgi:hypothetical protein